MTYTTLISAADLAAHARDTGWIVLDCRHDLANPDAGRDAYAAGHIPGAQFIHLDVDMSGSKIDAQGQFRGRHPLPEVEVFIEMLRRLGVNGDTQVIAYDAHGGMFAARLWWMLRWAGHAAVAVLDGGLPAWTAQGFALTSMPGGATRGHITRQPALVATVNAGDVLTNISTASRTLIDARAPDRFRGENETLDPVGGHIPGAKNRFFKDNLQADGCFKPAAELRAEWSALTATPQDSIMQCGSGVTACHNLLALEVAGLPGAALYPGSWSEWCGDASRLVATGNV